MLRQAVCIIFKPSWIPTYWSHSPETSNLGQNRQFLCRVTLKFDGWPWKTIWHFSYTTSHLVHHFITICEFKLELQSGNGKLDFDLCDLDLWTWLLSMLTTPENFMMIRWPEHCQKCVTNGQTDRQTGGRTDRRTEPYMSCLVAAKRRCM